MRIKLFSAAFLACGVSAGWLWDTEVPEINDVVVHDQTVIQLKYQNLGRSEEERRIFYTQVLEHLEGLKRQPLCHRTAAELLMNNCKTLENIDEHRSFLNIGNEQDHQVAAFAAALAMCDVGRYFVNSPGKPCSTFSEQTLFDTRQGGRKLQWSAEEAHQCVKSLSKDHSHWTTYMHHRGNALMYCRAARADIEQDQAIHIHQNLAEILQDFTINLSMDLEIMRTMVVEKSAAATVEFGRLFNQFDAWKHKIDSTFKLVSYDAKQVDKVMKSVLKDGENAAETIARMMQTMIKGSAEVTAQQRQDLEETSLQFHGRAEATQELAISTEETMKSMQSLMAVLVPIVSSLVESQAALDKQAQNTLSLIINATDGLQDHVEELYLATALAANITDQLQNAVRTASWYSSFNQQNRLPDCIIRAACVLTACIALQFQTDSTVIGKVGLLSGSLVFGEAVIYIKYYDWRQLYVLLSDNLVSNWTFKNSILDLTRWAPFKTTPSQTTAVGEFEEEDCAPIVNSDDCVTEDGFEEDVDAPISNTSDDITQNIFDDAPDSTFSLQRSVRSRHL